MRKLEKDTVTYKMKNKLPKETKEYFWNPIVNLFLEN